MSEPDIWGAVVPAWLGGVGGIAAAVVSTIALIKSLKTQGGVETLKEAANATATSVEASRMPTAPNGGEVPEASSSAPSQSPVRWAARHESRSKYQLRNDSTDTEASATLTGFQDVTPGGDDAASYAGPLPAELEPGATVPFTIDKSLVSPSVTAIELTWKDKDGTDRRRTLYI